MSYSISQIISFIKAKQLQLFRDSIVEHLLLDSRKLIFPSGTLFFALEGPRRNGVSFIPELYKKNVRNFVVSEGFPKKDIANYPEANFLQVSNTLDALQLLLAHHRS